MEDRTEAASNFLAGLDKMIVAADKILELQREAEMKQELDDMIAGATILDKNPPGYHNAVMHMKRVRREARNKRAKCQ